VPHRKNDVVDAIRLAGAQRLRRLFEPEHEARVGENRLDRQAHAVLEIALRAALVIKAHQVGEIVARQHATIRPGAEPADDLAGATGFVGSRRRTAREDATTDGGVGHAGDFDRAGDGELTQVRQRGDTKGFADVGVRERVLDRRDEIVNRTIRALDERGRHALRPRRDVDWPGLNAQAALV
jgi:hypothetical protein